MRTDTTHRASIDRAISSVAWWTPELIAVLGLALLAVAVPVIAPIALALAGVVLCRVLLTPVAWRFQDHFHSRRVRRELAGRDRRAAARRRTVETAGAGTHPDDRGAA